MKYTIPLHIFFHYTRIWKKDLCRGVVYFTVLCDHPCLVSLLFAVLVSLHPVTFSNVFYYCLVVSNAVSLACSLDGNDITDKAAGMLADALKVNQTLQYLRSVAEPFIITWCIYHAYLHGDMLLYS